MDTGGALRFPGRPDRVAQQNLPAMFALVPVEYGVVGEARDVRIDVTPRGGCICPDERSRCRAGPPRTASCRCLPGRAQPQIDATLECCGEDALGTMPWAVFGGVEVKAEPV